MEGFKKLPKMQYFKTGGSVTPKFVKVVEKTTKVAPTGNKKANAKSAAVAPKEKEAKVDITTMKKGGRAKKAVGTVKKFVKENLKQEAKKASGDKDKIAKVKDTSKKAAAPSKAKVKGKEIKKFADGGLTGYFNEPNSPTPFADPNSPAPTLAPGLSNERGPYVMDEGFGNGPYPAGYSAPGWGPNLGPTDMPIGAPGGQGTLSPYPNTAVGTAQPNALTISNPTNPMQPPVSPSGAPTFSPTFTNTNTFNASGDGGYGFGGGANPMQNPAGQQPYYSQRPAGQAPAPAAPSGSVNLLPSLFGAK